MQDYGKNDLPGNIGNSFSFLIAARDMQDTFFINKDPRKNLFN